MSSHGSRNLLTGITPTNSGCSRHNLGTDHLFVWELVKNYFFAGKSANASLPTTNLAADMIVLSFVDPP